MSLSLLTSAWHRAESHRWVDVDGHPRLTNALPAGWVVHHGVTYAPLADEPALFRTFASTEPTREGMRAFANRFGLLGTGEQASVRGPLGYPHTADAESERAWRVEIHAMRLGVALWEAASTKSQSKLRQMVEWGDGLDASSADAALKELTRSGLSASAAARAVASARTPTVVLLHDPLEGGALVGTARPGDYGLKPDGKLGTGGWSALLWLLSQRVAAPNVSVGVAWDLGSAEDWAASRPTPSREPGVVLQLRPQSLLNAIWLQFAQAVAGGRQYRRCEYRKCREWFELSAAARGRRTTAEYCAEPKRCRLNEWRERQRERARAKQKDKR